jgi:hypothetical protein
VDGGGALSKVERRLTHQARTSLLTPASLGLIIAALLSICPHRTAGQEPLVCGQPLQRSLEAGAVAAYTVSYRDPEFPDEALVEAVDTSGKIGLLKLALRDDPLAATCSGVLDLEEEAGIVEVSDCVPDTDTGTGQYTITLNVVSDSPGNCGEPLPCRLGVPGTLDVLGQVNAYTFPVSGDEDQVTLTLAAAEVGAYHVRIFDPDGFAIEDGDSCDRQVTFEALDSGIYTALVSACGSPHTGSYTIAWQPPQCPVSLAVGSASGQPGQQASVGVTLSTMGHAISDVVLDVGFDASTPVAWRADETPDCEVNPEIPQEGASFAFLPDGCDPGADCTDLHAVVSATGGVTSFRDGQLFTCTVRVQPAASVGAHPLTCSDPQAFDIGGDLPFTICSNGTITVGCTGDCDSDGQVTIDEVIQGVNIALDLLPVSVCAAFDASVDGRITIDELLTAVNYALIGCEPDSSASYDR